MEALAMQRFPFTWSGGSVIGAILLSTVLVFRLISFFPPQFHRRASLDSHPTFQVRCFIGEAPIQASQEVKQEVKQQNKQALASLVFLRLEQRHSEYSRLLWLPLSYPDHRDSFFPRKLPPSSATDDPLPS